MKVVETKNLVKNYDNGEVITKVLHGIDFSVDEGEFVAIMGPSGSGKSTLMYQMGLIDEPTSGEIFIEGKDVVNIDVHERQQIRLKELGFVFQDYALIPELTAAENVMVPLIMMGYSKEKAHDIAQKFLEKVGLGHRLNNTPSQLSGGEQQRVSVARAVANEPTILMADEPTASLDTNMSEQVMDVLKDLNKAGQTIIMVTHEDIYGKMAQRVVRLRDGNIEDYGNGKKK
ncbi:ATP-binding cassette domain-containing protein [Candidatus Peregrinibacteria bacterium]|nr:ATP-binding cassette domain-containing protein [Candidatus Peregrinibacteria bacterium]